MITTECDEVSLPGLVKSFQSPGHDARVRQANCPTQAKTGLEWATAR